MKTLALLLLLGGCQAHLATRPASIDAAVFDETAPLEATPETVDLRIQSGALDVARLRSADGNIYSPSFRLLEDGSGRLRLIVQDPLTHRYKLVR